jgi:type IV fimbrial biogenesis protein FimT
VELVFAIAIVAILMTLALPNFRTWMLNAQIRNAAESMANGLQRARAEAVARNASIEFVLAAGSTWTVDYVIKPVVTDPPIDTRNSNEGSPDVTVAVLPAGATTITFNNLGAIQPNADASATLSQIDLAGGGASQSLRVTINVGGSSRMCDPSLAPGSSPRAC